MFKRVFVVVFDSLGIGRGKDAEKFNDVGSDTLKSVLVIFVNDLLKCENISLICCLSF